MTFLLIVVALSAVALAIQLVYFKAAKGS